MRHSLWAGVRITLDEGKTKDLSTLAWWNNGAPVVPHQSPQFSLLGVSQTSHSIIGGFEQTPEDEHMHNFVNRGLPGPRRF